MNTHTQVENCGSINRETAERESCTLPIGHEGDHNSGDSHWLR